MYIPVDSLEAERRLAKDSPWCKRAVRKVLRSSSPPWGLNEKVLEKWRAKKKLLVWLENHDDPMLVSNTTVPCLEGSPSVSDKDLLKTDVIVEDTLSDEK